MIPYDSEAEAVDIANASEYGLAGYVSSGDIERARRVARRLRAGSILVNCPDIDVRAPFGCYKRLVTDVSCNAQPQAPCGPWRNPCHRGQRRADPQGGPKRSGSHTLARVCTLTSAGSPPIIRAAHEDDDFRK
jgi:hypothetical protein